MRKRDSDGASQKKKVKGKKKQAQAEEDAIEVEGSGKKRRQGEEKESGDAKKEDEVQRRALQREIQQLVVRLRSEGKTPSEIKAAKLELKATSGAKPNLPKRKKQREWEESATSQRKWKLQQVHDLVIIPVVWRGRHDKDDVLRAADDIKACLAQQGLDVWLDGRRHLTPGQKFAHWEHRGVLLRVEIGPEDLKDGVCQLCLAHTPGDYQSVERKCVPLPPAGTRALLLSLKEWGLTQIEIERREGDSEEEEKPKKRQAEGTQVKVDSDVQGNWIPREEGKRKKARK